MLACGKGYAESVSLTFQSTCVSSCLLAIVTASEQMEQAQEQVQDIEVDADSQQNGRLQRVLGELDPLDVVDDEATEQSYTH